MTYDFHGSWNVEANYPAPLYTDDESNIDFIVQYWISKGASPMKICLGIPLYGRSWILSTNQTLPPAPASGAGTPGLYTDEEGLLAYSEICTLLKNPQWTVEADDQSGIYAYSTETAMWVGYDDVDTVVLKTKYAINRHLAGVMVWDVSMDDFRGSCEGVRNPLTSAIADTLNATHLN